MILCLDVGYGAAAVTTACVGLDDWPDATPAFREVIRSTGAAAGYVPGRFYERELPFLLQALARLPVAADILVVDGYVWLGPGRAGLGARLHEAIGGRSAVVGVAKNAFRSADGAIAVTRGRSRRPLFVTAVGIDVAVAADGVRAMHGAHRIPTALQLTDRLTRA